jgi:drug/metabolite transporter (DMT)-like permease
MTTSVTTPATAPATSTTAPPALRQQLPLLLVMFFWGTAFTISKPLVGEAPHAVVAALRFGGGAILLLPVLLRRSATAAGPVPATGRSGRRPAVIAAACGVLGVFAYNALFYWSLSLAPAVDGSIIVPVLSPVLTTLLVVGLRWEKVTRIRSAGLALGVTGAALYLLAAGGAAGGQRLLGDLGFVAAAASWAAYTVMGRRVLTGIEPVRATAWAMLAGSALLLLWSAPELAETDFTALSGGFWLSVAYLVVGPTAVAYVLYYRGVRDVGSSRAAVMMFLVPVIGSACSMGLLGERIAPLQGLGAVVMLAGAALAAQLQPRLRSVAKTAASTRERTPSFSSMRATCSRAVRSVMPRR